MHGELSQQRAFSDADNLFPGLQIPQSTNDTNANNYDNVLRETNDLNPPEDSIKEPRPSCKESSPAADETRTLRRSARLRDPDTKAFVSVHNYAHPVDSPSFHSPSETNNTSLRVALDDIGNIHCNDPLTINYTYPWLKTLSLCNLTKNPSSSRTNCRYSNPRYTTRTSTPSVKGRQGQTHPRPSSLGGVPRLPEVLNTPRTEHDLYGGVRSYYPRNDAHRDESSETSNDPGTDHRYFTKCQRPATLDRGTA